MGIFMVILCFYPICDTFTESTAPNKLSESVLKPFGHHEDDQEAQEHPLNDCLLDFGYIDGDFVFFTPSYATFLKLLGPSKLPKIKK